MDWMRPEKTGGPMVTRASVALSTRVFLSEVAKARAMCDENSTEMPIVFLNIINIIEFV
jgi:hypothetical protein